MKRMGERMNKQKKEEFARSVVVLAMPGMFGDAMGAAFGGKQLESKKLMIEHLKPYNGLTADEIIKKGEETRKTFAERRPTQPPATAAMKEAPKEVPAAKPKRDGQVRLDPNFVPDPKWSPEPGDNALTYNKNGKPVFLAKDIFAYRDMIKSLSAGDTEGVNELARGRRLLVLDSLTPVLVIEVEENRLLTGGIDAIELRVKGGEHHNRSGFAMAPDLARLVDKRLLPPPPPSAEQLMDAAMRKQEAEQAAQVQHEAQIQAEPKPRKLPPYVLPKPKPKTLAKTSVARQASAAFRAAKELEAAYQTKECLAAYRKLVKDFPDSDEARLAKGRLKALTGE